MLYDRYILKMAHNGGNGIYQWRNKKHEYQNVAHFEGGCFSKIADACLSTIYIQITLIAVIWNKEESILLFTKNKEYNSRLNTLPIMRSITPRQSQHLNMWWSSVFVLNNYDDLSIHLKDQHAIRHDICQKFYTTGFSGQKSYIIKMWNSLMTYQFLTVIEITTQKKWP